MAHEWDPDRLIGADLAARTIAAQFPELAGEPVGPFDAGWDNAVFLVGERWAFRFVHREIALDGSRRELAVLGRLGPLPLPVPRPLFVGSATDDVPWPFWGAELLPGVGLADSGLPATERGAVAEALGAFLRALHAQDPAAFPELPEDPIRRADPARQAERAGTRLTSLSALPGATGERAAALLEASADLRAAAARGEPGHGRVLVHGDLHARHVLVDAGRATGVIDWGDTCVADASVDLMVAWAAFDAAERSRFFAAYGPVDDATALRARATALHVCAALAHQSATDGQAAVLAEAFDGMARALSD